MNYGFGFSVKNSHWEGVVLIWHWCAVFLFAFGVLWIAADHCVYILLRPFLCRAHCNAQGIRAIIPDILIVNWSDICICMRTYSVINPDYDISVWIISVIIYYEIFWLYLQIVWLPHLGQSRWEDKVTATNITGSSTLTKTLLRGCSWVDL